MKMTEKTILIKDDSKFLFFVGGLLQKMERSGYKVFLENMSGYGDFLNHFPDIQLKNKQTAFDLIINLSREPQPLKKGELNLVIENRGLKFSTDDLFDQIEKSLSIQDFKDKNLLITAGPTAEDIDPVRFLTNRSTGKMGIALARTAFIRGANIKLILGPGPVDVPPYLNVIKVRSAAEMHQAVLKEFYWCNYYFSSAAVADYTPVRELTHKMKKGKGNLNLEMERTKDILQDIGALKKSDQTIIGFSVETENLVENSRQKLIRKNLDVIIANNPSIKGAGFGGDTNQVEIITKNNHSTLPMLTKIETAEKILDYLLSNPEN
jgi:phosphopantothenoylcysteine decarboxylase / phosphopantothenate---cysteine ligase